MTNMRVGVRLGVDVGRARIGVAICDRHGLLATPLETVRRDGSGSGDDLRRIVAIAREHDAFEIVVGLPLGLSGHRTASTDDADEFAQALAGAVAPIAVRLIDERLSTVSAQQQLRQAGKRSRGTRDIIDQAAAVVILQHALDIERGVGAPSGTLVNPTDRTRTEDPDVNTPG